MITELIRLRVGDNPHLQAPFKIKLIMKGIDPDSYTAQSPDDPIVIQRLKTIAQSMGHAI
jgi:hypothetical protein